VFDVLIHAPVAGVLTWLHLASGVGRDVAEAIASTCIWETKCVPCVEPDPSSETARFVTTAVWRPTPGTEYTVWMQYPRHGDKTPWGVIADHLTQDQAEVYANHLTATATVMPRRKG